MQTKATNAIIVQQFITARAYILLKDLTNDPIPVVNWFPLAFPITSHNQPIKFIKIFFMFIKILLCIIKNFILFRKTIIIIN